MMILKYSYFSNFPIFPMRAQPYTAKTTINLSDRAEY